MQSCSPSIRFIKKPSAPKILSELMGRYINPVYPFHVSYVQHLYIMNHTDDYLLNDDFEYRMCIHTICMLKIK